MVFIENEAMKKTELLAVCELCDIKIANAQQCFIDMEHLTFMCRDCYEDTPSLKDMEELIEKIRSEQQRWGEKKLRYKAFAPETSAPIFPDSVTEVELPPLVEELRV